MSLLDHDFKGKPNVLRKPLRAQKHAKPTHKATGLMATALVVPFPSTPTDTDTGASDTSTSTSVASGRRSVYAILGKRLFDFIVVATSAVFWLPMIAICAFLIALDGRNPFYTQRRVGRNGRVFRMLKLRSMVPDADALLETHLATNPQARAEWDTTQKLKNDPRITRLGRIIRKTSFDELPQLLNVLRGDMSLVGPRPFMTSQAELYEGEAYYHLRPGLTGFWQVSDRNNCSFKGRARFDDDYLRQMSLSTDLRVLTKTVGVVLRGTGY